MVFIIEILISMFAGYCCCYFIADKLVSMTPEQVVVEWLRIIEKELKDWF